MAPRSSSSTRTVASSIGKVPPPSQVGAFSIEEMMSSIQDAYQELEKRRAEISTAYQALGEASDQQFRNTQLMYDIATALQAQWQGERHTWEEKSGTWQRDRDLLQGQIKTLKVELQDKTDQLQSVTEELKGVTAKASTTEHNARTSEQNLIQKHNDAESEWKDRESKLRSDLKLLNDEDAAESALRQDLNALPASLRLFTEPLLRIIDSARDGQVGELERNLGDIEKYVYAAPDLPYLLSLSHPSCVIWLQQLTLLQAQAHTLLGSSGLVPLIPQPNDPYDSELHESPESDWVWRSDGEGHNTVHSVLRIGFAYKRDGYFTKILRPARVRRCLVTGNSSSEKMRHTRHVEEVTPQETQETVASIAPSQTHLASHPLTETVATPDIYQREEQKIIDDDEQSSQSHINNVYTTTDYDDLLPSVPHSTSINPKNE